MSGIWYYVLALTGVSALTIVMVFTIRFAADELLGQTRLVWRLARPVWLTFTTAFTLLFVGAGHRCRHLGMPLCHCETGAVWEAFLRQVCTSSGSRLSNSGCNAIKRRRDS